MGGRHDYVALDWVKSEIEEVLKQAQYELEAYVESPDDTARMKFCLTYLHQVRGTLQMVEFYGAAMLAEEMEGVAQAMIDESVSDPAEAREVLMQAILQLPNYLDHIKLGHRDLPVVLLPVLNDLRGARGESLLSRAFFLKLHYFSQQSKVRVRSAISNANSFLISSLLILLESFVKCIKSRCLDC